MASDAIIRDPVNRELVHVYIPGIPALTIDWTETMEQGYFEEDAAGSTGDLIDRVRTLIEREARFLDTCAQPFTVYAQPAALVYGTA